MGSNPTLSAIESPDAETSRIHSGFDRENRAIPRVFGKIGFLKRTGDGGSRARLEPRAAFFSAAKLDGSLSLSIRPSEGVFACVMTSRQTPRETELLDHRVHIGVEWGV